VTPADYDYLCKLLKSRSGIMLSTDKQYLVESRMQNILRKNALPDISELVRRLHSADALISEVVEAMTTNETYFFRDKVPFDDLRQTIIPALLAARADRRPLRIWSAAAASGQEPYSLAMTVKEMADTLQGCRVEIVATDLSTEMLRKSEAGLFSQFEVQRGLPIQLLVKYFTQDGESWRISPELRGMVQHKPFNLLNDFAPLGNFDIIFCRNVLIYFDMMTKRSLLSRLRSVLAPDGYLVLGAAETMIGVADDFVPCADMRCVYRPHFPKDVDAPSVVPNMTAGRTHLRVVPVS
jgi:chemotaxis protein methyltransferase CheR